MPRRFLLLICVVFAAGVKAAPEAFEQGMNAMLEGNFAEAYCQWKPLAEKGHAEAQYNLGWLYANGNGMNVDLKQATDWWLAAASQGHADAQFAIGLALTTGEGLDKDLPEAIRWFVQAARQGHRDSRDILVRFNLDPQIDLLALQPGLMHEPWFGWQGKIAGRRVNIRRESSTKSEILAKLENGTPVRVLGRRGDWLQILLADEGNPDRLAWVYHSLVDQAVD